MQLSLTHLERKRVGGIPKLWHKKAGSSSSATAAASAKEARQREILDCLGAYEDTVAGAPRQVGYEDDGGCGNDRIPAFLGRKPPNDDASDCRDDDGWYCRSDDVVDDLALPRATSEASALSVETEYDGGDSGSRGHNGDNVLGPSLSSLSASDVPSVRETQPLGGPKYYVVAGRAGEGGARGDRPWRARVIHEAMPGTADRPGGGIGAGGIFGCGDAFADDVAEESGYEVVEYDASEKESRASSAAEAREGAPLAAWHEFERTLSSVYAAALLSVYE